MFGQLLLLRNEPSEVHDAGDSGVTGCGRKGASAVEVLLCEVALADGVDEEVRRRDPAGAVGSRQVRGPGEGFPTGLGIGGVELGAGDLGREVEAFEAVELARLSR